MAKWILAAIGVVAAACIGLVALAAVAFWQGASLAARAAEAGIQQARVALESAVPRETRDAAAAQIDTTITALREGRFDAGVLRETVVWLPGALLDGTLDAAETQALWEKMDRLTPEAPPPASG
jgi:hypothetical protein